MANVKQLKSLQALLESSRGFTNKVKDADFGALQDNQYWDRDFLGPRFPMAVTTSFWMRSNKFISLYINPKNITWSIGKRETTTKTAAGAIRNTWRNRYRGTYYDEPVLNITFQTGNIMPGAGISDQMFGGRVSTSSSGIYPNLYTENVRRDADVDAVAAILTNPPIPPGLQNFYDFLELVDQPSLDVDNYENRHILFYRTRVFPRMRIEGYFTNEPITFTESADGNANRLEWTASFLVYKTSPRFWKANELRNVFMDDARLNRLNEVIPNGFNVTDFMDHYRETNKIDLSDPKLPYKAISTDSGQRSGKKKVPGLVDPKSQAGGAKTATVLPAKVLSPAEATKANYAKLMGILATYQGKAGTWTGPITDSEFGIFKLLPELKREYVTTEGAEATFDEMRKYAAEWIRANADQYEQAAFDNLIYALEGGEPKDYLP